MTKDIDIVLKQIIELADDKKATDIRSYHFEEGEWIAEAVVIMSLSNEIHGGAMAQTFKEKLPAILAEYPDDFFDYPKIMGDVKSGWVIIDLNSIFIHVVQEDLRAFYALDTVFEKRAVVYHH